MHRDLKPQNVMVGQFGEVLVLDWGLAMVVGRSAGAGAVHTVRSEDDALATSLGTVSGTPTYMPPEQARGQTDRIGPASDVYSLGAILYQILAGRSPYPEGNADAVLQQVINSPPVPLSQLSVSTSEASRSPSAAEATVLAYHADASATIELSAVLVRPRPASPRLPMPEELVAACQRAMAREPAERFVDAAALAQEIAAWIEGARRREQVAMNPKYLFWDEPNSGLDPRTSILIDTLIKEITEEFGITTIVITHDMNSVREIGDNISFIYKGEKWWEGNKSEILKSDNKELNDFVYASKFMKRIKVGL